jgi:hypothetical protein
MRKWSRWRELNPRPPPYHGDALPLSHIGDLQERSFSSLTRLKKLAHYIVELKNSSESWHNSFALPSKQITVKQSSKSPCLSKLWTKRKSAESEDSLLQSKLGLREDFVLVYSSEILDKVRTIRPSYPIRSMHHILEIPRSRKPKSLHCLMGPVRLIVPTLKSRKSKVGYLIVFKSPLTQ